MTEFVFFTAMGSGSGMEVSSGGGGIGIGIGIGEELTVGEEGGGGMNWGCFGFIFTFSGIGPTGLDTTGGVEVGSWEGFGFSLGQGSTPYLLHKVKENNQNTWINRR